MRSRLLGAAKYVLYPAFYLFALFSCIYLTFPWEKLRDRMVAEFAKGQEKKGDRAWRLEIDELDGYWLSGVEINGARIIMPPEEEEEEARASVANKGALAKVASTARQKKADEEAEDGESGDKEKDEKKVAPKEQVVLIENATARVQLLPLLIGRVRLKFDASVFGGEVRGTVPFGGGQLDLEIENLNLGLVAPLKEAVSVPVKGMANGKLELVAEDGKWSKASGSFSLTVTGMEMGDGKSKFRKLYTMTPAKVGTFEILAKADQGTFKFEKFGATGEEVELAAEGTLKLKDPWDNSVLDLWLRFGFSDAYKNKDDRTKALFVDEGPFPALISKDKRLAKALRADGMWGFNIKGKLARLAYIPTKADSPKGRTGGDGSTAKKKKAGDDDDDDSAEPVGAADTPLAVPPTPRRAPTVSKGATPRNPRGEEPTPAPRGVDQPDSEPPPDPAPDPSPEPDPQAQPAPDQGMEEGEQPPPEEQPPPQ